MDWFKRNRADDTLGKRYVYKLMPLLLRLSLGVPLGCCLEDVVGNPRFLRDASFPVTSCSTSYFSMSM